MDAAEDLFDGGDEEFRRALGDSAPEDNQFRVKNCHDVRHADAQHRENFFEHFLRIATALPERLKNEKGVPLFRQVTRALRAVRAERLAPLGGDAHPRDMTFKIADFAEGRKRSEEHTSELQSRSDLVCRLLLEKKNITPYVRPLIPTDGPPTCRRTTNVCRRLLSASRLRRRYMRRPRSSPSSRCPDSSRQSCTV